MIPFPQISKIEPMDDTPETPRLSKERLPHHFCEGFPEQHPLQSHVYNNDSGGLNSTPNVSSASAAKIETSSIVASSRSSSSREIDHSGELLASNSSDLETEWVEQDVPGVYITIRILPNGARELKRVRFR